MSLGLVEGGGVEEVGGERVVGSAADLSGTCGLGFRVQVGS